MATTFTYPHPIIGVQDLSPRAPIVNSIVPLHLPIFPIFAAEGPLNVPILGSGDEQIEIFGARTFDERSPYYQHMTRFAAAAMGAQRVYLVRVADDTTAKMATLVLEAKVQQKDLTQYQKDGTGARITDGDGDWVPELEADNTTPLTEPGVSITWQVRALLANETLGGLTSASVTEGADTFTVYPILAFRAKWVGAEGNRVGVKLHYTPEFDSEVVERIDALTYRLAPVKLDATTNIASPIRDLFQSAFTDFSFKPQAYDSATGRYVTLDEIIKRSYTKTLANGEKTGSLPFEVHVYSAHIATIGALVKTKSPELDTELDPYRINLLSGLDEDGHHYDHLEITAASANVVNDNVVLYLRGGHDGTMTQAMLESLTVAYLSGLTNPDIKDYWRYPFSHVYDPGFSLTNKRALMAVLGVRDDVGLTLATQEAGATPNTKAEDLSAALTLRADALLRPESAVYGTPACRVEIYQQCGRLATATAADPWVPTTYDRLLKRCAFEGTDFVRGTPRGRPNNEVSVFRELNWVPAGSDHLQASWDATANTVQYYDVKGLYIPDVRTVYGNETSVLTNGSFVDHLIYLKHRVRAIWTEFVGRDDPQESLFDRIKTRIEEDAHRVFGNYLTVNATIYRTEADTALGYRCTVRVNVGGNVPNRIWDVIIPVNRRDEG